MKRYICLAAGTILIIIGLFLNEWSIAAFLSPDGVLEDITRFKIYGLNILLIGAGIFLVKIRNLQSKIAVLCRETIVKIILLTVVIICFEGVFYVLYSYKEVKYNWHTRGSIKIPDELLGFTANPGRTISVIKKAYGNTVYGVKYSIDEYSRRITPLSDQTPGNKFIMFLGGSFTFGEGVNDNETLPFYVSRSTQGYRLYNYGFLGYGAQAMLAKLEGDAIRDEVPEADGLLIYTFIDHHIRRAVGSMKTMKWGKDMPSYVINSNGTLVTKGSFADTRPFLLKFYTLLGKSNFIKYLGIELPFRVKQRDVDLTLKIIERSFQAYRRKFSNDNFYVLFYPGSKYTVKMVPYLSSAGIKCLDYSALFDTTNNKYRISKYDGHPSPQAYKIVAKKLIQDIKTLKQPENRIPG